MAIRVPRGYAVNRPYYREVCEGSRPNSQAAPRLPYTGLPHVRVDDVHHDPIVIDAGTIVGVIGYLTGALTAHGAGQTGSICPAFIGPKESILTTTGNNGILTTGVSAYINPATELQVIGSTEGATNWGLPGATSGDMTLGHVLPMGVVSQPIYSSYLPVAFTNYKRQHSVGIVTDYVIQIPATNEEEVLINAGDLVMLGSGTHYGIGVTDPYFAQKLAGRYSKYVPSALKATERIVGRCLKKTLLGQGGSNTSMGDQLAASGKIADFTANADLLAEFAGLDKVQTVPGLTLSGSETKGVPAFLLGARADSQKKYWALTILVRL